MNSTAKIKSLNNIEYKACDFKPEVYFIGQILGASNIYSKEGFFCDIYVEVGQDWKLLSSNSDIIQTHTAYSDYNNYVNFSHSFDFQYSVNTLNGWPKLICKVWKLDSSSKIDIYSYGCCYLPNTYGHHELEFNTWILQGGLKAEILSYYINTNPKMNTVDPVAVNLKERKEILSKPGPTIHLYCDVLLKNFKFHSITGQID